MHASAGLDLVNAVQRLSALLAVHANQDGAVTAAQRFQKALWNV